MKTILHPDYWAEIPAGEFLIGLSDTQRARLQTLIRESMGYEQFSSAQRQVFESILEKHRQRIEEQRDPKRAFGDLTPLNFTEEERSFSRRRPMIIEMENSLASLPAQTSYWLDRFYIARFPITKRQMITFGSGLPAHQLPGALEGAASQVLDDPSRPDLKPLLRRTFGRELEYQTREVAIIEIHQALRLCQELGPRLPTLLEWQKAARGTDGRLYPWGDEWDIEAGYFYRGQSISGKGLVDAFPKGVSPYGVWGMVGNLPEMVLSPSAIPGVSSKGCHPKEASEGSPWFDHLLDQSSKGGWVSLRLALSRWPQQQWPGFSTVEQRERFDPPRSVRLPALLPVTVSPVEQPRLTAENINQLVPLAEPITEGSGRIGESEFIGGLAWSPDGQILAAISWRDKIWIYRVGSSGPDISKEGRRQIAFSPDGTMLAWLGVDSKSLQLWQVDGLKKVVAWPIPIQLLTSLTFSPDGASLVSADSLGAITLWDVTAGSELKQFEHPSHVRRVVFNPTGRLLAAGGMDGAVLLWEISSEIEVARLRHSEGSVCDLSFSPEGHLLAAAGADGAVILWQVGAWQEQQRWIEADGHPAASLSFSPDGQLLAVGYANGLFKIWETASGRLLTAVQSDQGWCLRVAFSPDGKFLATSNRSVVLWGVTSEVSTEIDSYER